MSAPETSGAAGEAIRYCEDCVHCRPAQNYHSREYALLDARCAIGAMAHANSLVARCTERELCTIARMDGRSCGPKGNLFQPRAEVEAA